MSQTPNADHINYPLEVGTPGYIVTQATRRAIEQQRYLPFRPSLVGVNYVEVTQTVSYTPHQHVDYEIIFVRKGPYHCRLNRTQVEVSADRALIVCPGDTHEVELHPGQSHQILHFRLLNPSSDTQAKIPILSPSASPHQKVFYAPSELFTRLLDSIQNEQDRQQPFSTQIQDSLLQTLFWRVLNQLDPRTLSQPFQQQSSDQLFLQRLYALIERNIHKKLSVSEIAEELKIGRSSLAKRCQHLLGEAPSKIFASSKIRHAALLLSQPDVSVKEVSYRLGFQNQYHFSRVFKSIMGYPPSEARNRGSNGAFGDRNAGN
ncbi:MAG: AraC family transcriptional regulator [Symploca sp. SIO2D2]|nr:AraC family transcriptional regulator [Symploca sp. SIO2D2]